MGEQGGQQDELVEMEGGNNSQTTSQNKLQKVRVSMTTARQGRSPLASEAAPIEKWWNRELTLKCKFKC